MKNLLAIIILLVASTALKAQVFDKPDRGAVIRMNEYTHQIKAGASETLDVWLVKSKKESKRTFGGLASSIVNGIEVTFDEKEEGLYAMNIQTSSDLKPGNYTLIIKGTGKNAYKVRNTTFMLTVTSGKTGLASSSN